MWDFSKGEGRGRGGWYLEDAESMGYSPQMLHFANRMLIENHFTRNTYVYQCHKVEITMRYLSKEGFFLLSSTQMCIL